MGKYINKNSKGEQLPQIGKARALIEDGAVEVNSEIFIENMVCVVENGWMYAAAYAIDEREWEYFKRPDGRPKTWLWYPEASQLAE